jgi:hypothetical protein
LLLDLWEAFDETEGTEAVEEDWAVAVEEGVGSRALRLGAIVYSDGARRVVRYFCVAL